MERKKEREKRVSTTDGLARLTYHHKDGEKGAPPHGNVIVKLM